MAPDRKKPANCVCWLVSFAFFVATHQHYNASANGNRLCRRPSAACFDTMHFWRRGHTSHTSTFNADRPLLPCQSTVPRTVSFIPPALWATGGLEILSIKLPLYRASDPAPLEGSQLSILFSRPYKTPSDKRNNMMIMMDYNDYMTI